MENKLYSELLCRMGVSTVTFSLLGALKASASLGRMPHLPTLKMCPIIPHSLENPVSLLPLQTHPSVMAPFTSCSCSWVQSPAFSGLWGSCGTCQVERRSITGNPYMGHIRNNLRPRLFQRLCEVRRHIYLIYSFFCKHTKGFSRSFNRLNPEADRTQTSSLG